MAEAGDWYFEANGNRQGPISRETLVSLLAAKSVSRETLVWNPSFGGTWKKLGEVGLPEATGANDAPPPLPKAKLRVNNFFAWLIVLTPIVGGLTELIVTADRTHGSADGVATFYSLVVYTALCILDSQQIKKGGAETTPIIWFWIVPVYLFKRARLLGQSLLIFWSWLASLLLTLLFVTSGVATSAMYWGTGLPTCESGTIQSQVTELFGQVPLIAMIDGKALRIESIKEVSATETERDCSAVVLSNRVQRYPVTYKVTDSDEGFLVELQVQEP